ncbi:MAG: Rrf2 family transcriptional regulator [Candidatus Manganitrophus sp.]|nr:Rrf2 family transcriptional regulator [Candidatus Manganitrophus sp.]MDC4222792.1 Rrf2 family transcriptional regulator [Candidatus Manganitrophus sp.]WDT71202.1 MAG: Rrf2 family transcriptional regulator [Candidatus Manganitrophus sp.]
MVHFSAKSEYAVLAILALSLHSGEGPLQVRAIAQKERIPIRFLEQVMNHLKKRGFVESVRGPHGGYRLTRPPDQIRLGEVLQAMEGPLVEIDSAQRRQRESLNGTNGEIDNILIREVWQEVNTSLRDHLDSINFKDLSERKKELEGKQTLMFHI